MWKLYLSVMFVVIGCGTALPPDPNEEAVRSYGTPRAAKTEAECEIENVIVYFERVGIILQRQSDARKLFADHLRRGRDTPALMTDELWVAAADSIVVAMEIWQLNLHSLDAPEPVRDIHDQQLLASAALNDAWNGFYAWTLDGARDGPEIEAVNELMKRSSDHLQSAEHLILSYDVHCGQWVEEATPSVGATSTPTIRELFPNH